MEGMPTDAERSLGEECSRERRKCCIFGPSKMAVPEQESFEDGSEADQQLSARVSANHSWQADASVGPSDI